MMLSCVVYGCTNNSVTCDASIKYHPFPKNSLVQKWAEACGWQSSTLDLDTDCICSVHFDEAAYTSEIKMVDFVACCSKTLKPDAVPTLYLPQTQILIKEGTGQLEGGVMVYTINSINSSDGFTISLEEGPVELQPSTSEVKLETQTNPLKRETCGGNEKYDSIKTSSDLYLLQAHNKNLKRKIEKMEQELEGLQVNLAEKEDDYVKYDLTCKDLETQITNKKMFSPQDQKTLLSKVFSEAQIKILFGKKKVYWSNDDMAVGYIIRHLSNRRCYGYLTKNLNIPLPGISSIKRWVTAKKTKRIRT